MALLCGGLWVCAVVGVGVWGGDVWCGVTSQVTSDEPCVTRVVLCHGRVLCAMARRAEVVGVDRCIWGCNTPRCTFADKKSDIVYIWGVI